MMKVIASFLISSVLTISCYAACLQDNIPPASPPASAGFFLYKNDENISNESTIYHCDHCEPECSINCEQMPSRCASTALWCIRSIPKNSSMEESIDFSIDYNVTVEWIEPSPSQKYPQYSSSSTNHQLCLCSISNGAPCNSSSEEGVYKCIIKGDIVTETLQFTYSMYKLTSTSSTPGNNVTITSSSYQTIEVSTTASLSIETTTETSAGTSIISTTSTRTSVIISTETATVLTETTIASPHYTSSDTPSSLHSTMCSSTVKDQVSTIPHYAGIGLLLATNLLTLIVLVTSCVYIKHTKKQTKYALGRSRANVTVQSNPIGSLSVINIETEILNEEYDTCLQEQQQQQQQTPQQPSQQEQQQEQQQESSRPAIDIYSYAVDDEDYNQSNNDNDDYAVPADVQEDKRRGSNPPSVPPPYSGRGIDEVKERENGVGNSIDNTDCLYATIDSKEDEKELTSL